MLTTRAEGFEELMPLIEIPNAHNADTAAGAAGALHVSGL
jgi:hypothetical protein